MNSDNLNPEGRPGSTGAALLGLCPRCGGNTLFDGLAKFAPRCPQCQLDFSQFNVGDGPAAFLTLIIGALVVMLALWLEFSVHPPIWVHALIWVPVVGLAVIGGLRVSKAWLLQAEYQRKAREAVHSDLEGPSDPERNDP